MSDQVVFSPEAEGDLDRLFESSFAAKLAA
jgi:hypothetical protein